MCRLYKLLGSDEWYLHQLVCIFYFCIPIDDSHPTQPTVFNFQRLFRQAIAA
jgi:hypothetical protein